MRDATFFVVGHRAAKLLLGDFLVRDGFDDVGAGDEHVGIVAGHKNKVGDRRRIDGAAGARAHDGADLRNDAARERVAQKYFGVARERHHAFLNARAAGIVEADNRRALAHGEVHDFYDFSGVGFRERTAEHGEILREDVHEAAVDAAVAGDEAIARRTLRVLVHAEVGAVMADELVELFEGALIEEQVDALAGAELALLVFALATLGTAARFGFVAAPAKFGEAIVLFRVFDVGHREFTGPEKRKCETAIQRRLEMEFVMILQGVKLISNWYALSIRNDWKVLLKNRCLPASDRPDCVPCSAFVVI